MTRWQSHFVLGISWDDSHSSPGLLNPGSPAQFSCWLRIVWCHTLEIVNSLGFHKPTPKLSRDLYTSCQLVWAVWYFGRWLSDFPNTWSGLCMLNKSHRKVSWCLKSWKPQPNRRRLERWSRIVQRPFFRQRELQCCRGSWEGKAKWNVTWNQRGLTTLWERFLKCDDTMPLHPKH